jgi:opacity protein-like surface antigen
MIKVLAPAVVAVAAAGLVTANPASAKFYIFGSGMWTSVQDADVQQGTGSAGTLEHETGWGIAGGVGYIIGPKLRSELEIGYRSNDVERLTVPAFNAPAGAASGDVSVFSGMVSAYYDIVTWGPITPYLGAGVGFGNIDVDITVAGVNRTHSDTAFAYQGMAGIRYALTTSVDVKVGYRYFALLDPQFGSTESEYASHNVELGVAFKF